MRIFDLRTGRSFDRSERAAIDWARSELREGHGIICPTDTVFGLIADARDPEAVANIARLKGREASTPPPVLVESVTAAQALAGGAGAPLLAKVSDLWPGPLSVVVDVEDPLGRIINPDRATVALRVPAIGWLRQLSQDLPLAASSANRHGRPTPVEVTEVIAEFIDFLDEQDPWLTLALDLGVAGSIASTVLDLTQQPPRVLRHGAVTCELLRRYLTDLECIHGGS
ncbi:MAG: L-threonylcarbamoyladenylate synthase [Ferrimicrobium sp.]|jgi:L-threonylcarbamoyladenylate synthase|uniref:L-threonylcarbamoyladenylate synthase n=1 Tax=Ferrimicrobium sp. TaxID=2926050 RepID=UPI00260BC1A8|nr:L-threonylcarbamoyladenylate synthase [Ferrimicrobium sp.]MCL5973132.1 L-threonylcarbamoyladenylate synthase [Actinomycetota bacterium]